MIIISDLNNLKRGEHVILQCEYCQNEFDYKIGRLNFAIKNRKMNWGRYCSDLCLKMAQIKRIDGKCENCNGIFNKTPFAFKRSKNHFCSQSCAATYHNTHKVAGYRRSKLEIWLESKLTELYTNLEIHFNRKDAINSELDIYIPSLKLAVEINGIFHYKPIYGEEQLKRVKNNDNKKLQICSEKDIKLVSIDISKEMHFKPDNSIKYLNIIISHIDLESPDFDLNEN